MAALAHTLLGSPALCGLCRAINPKEDYKLCAWGGLAREINASGISISRANRRDNSNLTGRWKLNAVHTLTIHNASAPTTVEIPVTCYKACAALAALEQGKFIHGYILRRGLDSTLPVMSSLITMYERCGKLELGQQVFNMTKKKDVVSWNSLVSSYGIHGYRKKAIQNFEDMINHGVSPSHISFVSVLGAYSHEGLVEEGKVIFESMVREHGLYPSIERYACMVDLLDRANRLDEAAKVIEDMRIEPGAQVWGALLGSCRIHCNVELAERVSKRLFEPRNTGNYVHLADIYAEAKMWDEVKRVKKKTFRSSRTSKGTRSQLD